MFLISMYYSYDDVKDIHKKEIIKKCIILVGITIVGLIGYTLYNKFNNKIVSAEMPNVCGPGECDENIFSKSYIKKMKKFTSDCENMANNLDLAEQVSHLTENNNIIQNFNNVCAKNLDSVV